MSNYFQTVNKSTYGYADTEYRNYTQVPKIKITDCKFTHYRRVKVNEPRSSHQKIVNVHEEYYAVLPKNDISRLASPRGGITICTYVTFGVIKIGYALCANSDVFTKKIGNLLAYQNMLDYNLEVALPETNDDYLNEQIQSGYFLHNYIEDISTLYLNYIGFNMDWRKRKILGTISVD